jgi:hypothetical protein
MVGLDYRGSTGMHAGVKPLIQNKLGCPAAIELGICLVMMTADLQEKCRSSCSEMCVGAFR